MTALKVIHSTPVWLPQTQTWVHTQVDCVPADEVENHVVCEQTANLEQFPVRNLHDFSSAGSIERFIDRGLRRLGLRRHLGYLSRVARRMDADLIHSHFGDVAWRDLGAARAARVAQVVTFYGYDMSELPKQKLWCDRYAELFRAVALVLCEGPHMAACIVEAGCPAHKVRVHHLGVRMDRIEFRPRQWRPGEKLRVLIASTFAEKKGIPYGLRALGRLAHELELELTIIGDARDTGPSQLEKAAILAALDEQGLGGRTRLLGYQPHARMMDEAYRHHLFLAPSVTARDGGTEGGAPVSLIEMAASGMPIVSSRHCDIPEVVLDGQTGYLAAERDVDGLLQGLLRATRAHADWPALLARGRAHVEKEFDAMVQGRRLAALYRDAAGAGR